MSWLTPRWQLMQPQEKRKKKKKGMEDEKSSSCPMCAVGREPRPFLIMVSSLHSGPCEALRLQVGNLLSNSIPEISIFIYCPTAAAAALSGRNHVTVAADRVSLFNQSNQFTFDYNSDNLGRRRRR